MAHFPLKPTYSVISNRAVYPLAQTDDLEAAGRIVDALMRTRSDPEWSDFWVCDCAGNEYYHDANLGTVFSAPCFVQEAA